MAERQAAEDEARLERDARERLGELELRLAPRLSLEPVAYARFVLL